MNEDLVCFLEANRIPYEVNVDLKKKTWIHRGGMCDFFISPHNSNQLLRVTQYLYSVGTKFQLLGHTSNVYILNTTNIPVIVSTKKCCSYQLCDDRIICESGASVIRMANDMIRQGVVGFEYLTGLPGTIGAAIYNNSSCKSNSISQLLINAEVLLEDGQLITMTTEDMQFAFRTSIFKEGRLRGVIIRTVLKAERGNAVELQGIAKENNEERGRILEGHAKNLGCTVNRCFINGRMPLLYYFPYRVYMVILKLVVKDPVVRKRKAKSFLCGISGYRKISPYISDINPIIFVWRDAGADAIFSSYLSFMQKVYKTDKVEIEII